MAFPPSVGGFALFVLANLPLASSALVARHPSLRSVGKRKASCVMLANHGTHSTVDIHVGTPEQTFSVVADTGSDNVIVPSCLCQESHHCNEEDRCFRGTNISTTFDVVMGLEGPLGTIISFGSGPIEAVIASDVVRVGDVTILMDKSLLLMVDQNLNIPSFEGILGLGLPMDRRPPLPTNMPVASEVSSDDGGFESLEDVLRHIMGGDGQPNRVPSAISAGAVPLVGHSAPSKSSSNSTLWAKFGRANRKGDPEQPGDKNLEEKIDEPMGFFEQAAVGRFSICFNDGADGMMRLNPPAATKTLGNIGRNHWALDFRGISVGSNTIPLGFCGGEGMRDGQETPCGAVPDSGTTVIMAPQEHLDLLYEGLCDEWDRCRDNHTALMDAAEAAHEAVMTNYHTDPFGIKPASKSTVFQFLLLDCASWMSNSQNLDELPPLHFTVLGADGTEQVLEMPGWSYVMMSEGQASNQTICEPAFGAMDLDTELNGPVWIFGTPFFYTHEVGYDLEASPAGISFSSLEGSACGSCNSDGTVALVSGSSFKKRQARSPRRVSGRRLPSMDPSLPL